MQRAGALSTAARGLGRLCAGLGLASIAVTLAALAARLWWVAELLTHFRVQLFVGQLLVAFVLIAARRPRLALGVAVAAALNGWYIEPVVWPAASVVASAGAELSVMTVNVSAHNRDAGRLVSILERTRPDIVLVVELTPRWVRDLEPVYAEFAYRELAPDTGAFGLGLLSRYPIKALSRPELGGTVALDALVDGPAGSLRVLGVHLRSPVSARRAAERNAGLRRLARRRASIEGPLVVLGDLNLSPYSPYYTDWLAASGLTDTLAGRGPSMTWPSFMPVLGIPIDHCFVTREFTLLERRHLSEFGSDHYPVLVRLLEDVKR